jgi:SSS family solute:Na+ symporter
LLIYVIASGGYYMQEQLLQPDMGVDFWTGAVVLVLVTGVHCYGGLNTVMYTGDTGYCSLMGSAVLLYFWS